MNRFATLLIFITLLLFAPKFLYAQSPAAEFVKREVKVGSETYGYRVYVPANFNPKKKHPVMLFLHGNGVNGRDNERQVRGIMEVVAQNPQLFNFIIVFPQARANTIWVGEMLSQAFTALDQTVTEYNGDRNRLYLSGFSLGGYGTWTGAVLAPNKFAALVPIAGGIVPPYALPKTLKQSLPISLSSILDAPSPYDALAQAVGKTPVWITHGNADESVPVTESRQISQALKKNGNTKVVYIELDKTNHNDAFFKAFSNPALYRWLAKQKLINK